MGGSSVVLPNYEDAHITNRTLCTFLNEVHVCGLNGLTSYSKVPAQIVHGSLKPTRQSERSLSFGSQILAFFAFLFSRVQSISL